MMNWKARRETVDAVVLSALSSEEADTYLALKQAGVDEAAIFNRMYPSRGRHWAREEVHVPIVLLNKTQLAYLIETRLCTSLPSLNRLRKQDLMTLFVTLRATRKDARNRPEAEE
ncbi:MAG: hypothetical protein ACE5G0_08880 [Rhodothermales bacterium]